LAVNHACRIAAAMLLFVGVPIPAQQRDTMRLVVPQNAVSFLAIGDWGAHGSLDQRRVAQQMGLTAEALSAAFVLALGDNFYPDGVSSASDRQFFTSWEGVYRGKSLQVDWYAMLGNHDYHGNPQAQVDYALKNSRWKMPARYYSVKKAVAPGVTAEFIILDTSPFVVQYYGEADKRRALATADTVAQRKWLDSTLKASTAQWKFIVGHQHVYTGGERETQPELEALLVGRMKQYGVAAYICGHEHDLEHLVPAGSTTHYFVSGAGSEARKVRGREGSRFKGASPGFMAMSLTADSLVVQFVDRFGAMLYRTSVRR
jgi:hypothetical protein